MKIISLLLLNIPLLTLSLSSTATECKISPNLISAYYTLSHQSSVTGKTNETPPQLFELHRDNNRVLQRDISQGIDDVWSLNGNRLSLSRAFEKYQHAIEYQANELHYQPEWRNISQLVVTPDLDNMQLVEQNNSGCQLEQHYVLKSNQAEYQLVWLPNLRLVKYFQMKNSQLTKQWRLTDYQDNAKQITSLFNQYASYQNTDYADVGDNEAIPFLAAMINQGFSTSHRGEVKHPHHQAH